MPFKKKPVIIVGRGDWAVEVPRPPFRATHVVLTMDKEFKHNGKPKTSMQRIDDFGAFKGVSGRFSYVRCSRDKSRKVLEKHDGRWYWDGKTVEGIDNIRNKEYNK